MQVEIFNNLLNSVSIISEFGDLSEDDYLKKSIRPTVYSHIGTEEIEFLQKTGLPIAKEGKLQIGDEGVNAILSAFDKSMLRYKSFLREKKAIEEHQSESNITMQTATTCAIKKGISQEDVKDAENQFMHNIQSNIVSEEDRKNE